MDKILSRVKSDFRIVFIVLLWVFMCLEWFSTVATVTMDYDEMGIGEYMDYSSESESYSESYSFFEATALSFSAYVLFFIPIIFLLAYFIPGLNKYGKVLYSGGSLLGLILTIIVCIYLKGTLAASASSYGVSASVETKMGIGALLTWVDYAAIIVYSLVKDFRISKESLKSGNLKDVANSVVKDFSDAASTMTQDIKSGELAKSIQMPGITCPQCGETIAIGKKFCKSCGYKVENLTVNENVAVEAPSAGEANTVASNVVDNSANESIAPVEGSNQTSTANKNSFAQAGINISLPTKKILTKEANIRMNGVVCKNCGLLSDYSKKFCVDCGTALETPVLCSACGAAILNGKQFCADCGTPVSEKKKCATCGAELFGNRKFCGECGVEINYKKQCEGCGADIVPGKRFCPDCGKPYQMS